MCNKRTTRKQIIGIRNQFNTSKKDIKHSRIQKKADLLQNIEESFVNCKSKKKDAADIIKQSYKSCKNVVEKAMKNKTSETLIEKTPGMIENTDKWNENEN